jgi:predicted house-cleaning NTP pyrophosphatase (Maf/HAM1 superfamily)
LLDGVGLDYRVERPGVDEELLKAGFSGTTEAMATMLAEAKAGEVSAGRWSSAAIRSPNAAGCGSTSPSTATKPPSICAFFRGKR